MMNRLGKGLVLLNLAMSMLFLAMALAIFFQAIDWGWKEARKDLTYRVASEIDKRSAAIQGAHRVVALLTPGLASAQQNLAETEPFLGDNHLWYRKLLDDLRSAKKEITVKEIKVGSDGSAVVDGPKGKRLGKTVLDETTEITKSFTAYVDDLKTLQETIDTADKAIRGEVEKEKALTLKLNGTREKGKTGKLGLYALLEQEADAQAKTRFEKGYLQRQLSNVEQEFDLYMGRQRQLEKTVERMKKLRAGK
jgi:hypothetical protein